MRNKIIHLFILLFSFQTQAKLLTENDYKQIEQVFIKETKKQGQEVRTINIDDYKNITEEEKESLNIIKKENSATGEIAKHILNGNVENRHVVILSNQESIWLMANKLKPNSFVKENCAYLHLIGSNYDCLNTYPQLKIDLKNFLKFHKVIIDEEYFANFFFIHELSHLLPQQKVLPKEIDITRIWLDNPNHHYREIHSDLFTAIFLHNYLNYNVEFISNIVLFRDFNLTANADLEHYSTPYVKELIKSKEWFDLKSFKEIDDYIQKIFIKVNKEYIISKKTFKMIHYKNFEWCNNLDLTTLKSREEYEIVSKHCKKMKIK